MTLALADYRLALRARALTLAVATTDGDFARATTATYVDADGVVQTAAIDEPRHAHYVAGVGPSSLYEAAATNLAVVSEDFGDAAWTNVGSPAVSTNAAVAPDGATTADTITDASAVESRGKRQTWTVADDATAYVASVYLAKTSGTPAHFPCLNLRLTGGTTVDAYVVVNTTTGAVFDSVVSTAGTESVGDYWRLWISAANNASGNTTALVSVYPAWRGDLTATDLDVATTGAATFWGVQLETGTTPTSYIPTTTLAATRAADTGGASLAATGSTYTRAAGSFITDGFRVGMEVTPVGFSDLTRRTIRQVTALTLTVDSAPTAQTVTTGRALLVGMPATRTYENVDAASSIVQPAPWTAETLLPGTLVQDTIGPLGWMEQTAIYQWTFHVTADAGPSALDRYADALMVHLAPRLALTTDDGTVVRVRSDVGVQRSPVLPSDTAGYASVSVSFPVRVRTPNTL